MKLKNFSVVLLLAIGTLSLWLPTGSCSGDHEEELLDACNFFVDENIFIFCHCDGSYLGPEATGLNCAVNLHFKGRENAPEWDAISRATNATHLEFTTLDKKINAFPPNKIFRNMQYLQYMKISSANIASIPAYAFYNSSSISSVSLSSNLIQELSVNAFANMPLLSNLQLEVNQLTEINRGVFVNLPKLTSLHLERNSIHTIHDGAFKELHALETLQLQANNITTITPEVFTGLDSLKHLDLRRNSITFLGHNVFEKMPLLDDLDLTENQINAVNSLAFSGLKELRRLNLKGNKIVKFEPATFSHSPQIYFLDLRLNALDSLSKDVFMEDVYENLKLPTMEFMAEGNRLQCDCSMIWMARLYNETESLMVKYHLNLTDCDVPQKYSRSYDEEDVTVHSQGRVPGNVTLVRGPIEDTTPFSTGPSIKVIQLKEEALNCRARGKGKKNRDRLVPRNKSRGEEPQGRTQESLTGKTGPSEPQEQEQVVDSSATVTGIKLFTLTLVLVPLVYSTV